MSELVPDRSIDDLTDKGFMRLRLRDGYTFENTFEAARHFFRLPVHKKEDNQLPEDFGYRPFGVEYSQSPARPDPIESFTASKRTKEEKNQLRSAKARILYDHMLSVIDTLEPLAEALTIKLAAALGRSDRGQQLRGGLTRWSCLQLNYSRPGSISTDLIHELHEDGHFMTIACATQPGLEIQDSSNSFMALNTDLDEVIIMPGELAWLLTGGKLKPAYHRVRRVDESPERMAILFFADIDPKLCKPWVKSEVNTNVDIGSRVLTNSARFGVRAFRPE